MNLFDKLKSRWQIESNTQFIVILIVFACTGFTALYARKFVFGWLGVTDAYPFWQRAIIWLLTIFPLYNVFLYFYGFIFGQRKFFTWFLKKVLARFVPGMEVPKREEE